MCNLKEKKKIQKAIIKSILPYWENFYRISSEASQEDICELQILKKKKAVKLQN